MAAGKGLAPRKRPQRFKLFLFLSMSPELFLNLSHMEGRPEQLRQHRFMTSRAYCSFCFPAPVLFLLLSGAMLLNLERDKIKLLHRYFKTSATSEQSRLFESEGEVESEGFKYLFFNLAITAWMRGMS